MSGRGRQGRRMKREDEERQVSTRRRRGRSRSNVRRLSTAAHEGEEERSK